MESKIAGLPVSSRSCHAARDFLNPLLHVPPAKLLAAQYIFEHRR